jgi:hypothetical protein
MPGARAASSDHGWSVEARSGGRRRALGERRQPPPGAGAANSGHGMCGQDRGVGVGVRAQATSSHGRCGRAPATVAWTSLPGSMSGRRASGARRSPGGRRELAGEGDGGERAPPEARTTAAAAVVVHPPRQL